MRQKEQEEPADGTVAADGTIAADDAVTADDRSARLPLQGIDHALRGTVFHGRLHHFRQIDSTNTRALAAALAGAESGQVYIADEQTAGRGRGGHTWHSEPERGLYLTALVRPRLRADEALKLSLMAGIAASEAIFRSTGCRIDLRWPNDLVTAPVHGTWARKLGGILTESASSPEGHLRHAAIGIGINLNQREFPAELASAATSLRLLAGAPVDRAALAAALLLQLDGELRRLQEPGGAVQLLRRFGELSSWVRGKRVRVDEDEGYTGLTDGLSADGLLRIRCDSGAVRSVRHGGVRELLSRD